MRILAVDIVFINCRNSDTLYYSKKSSNVITETLLFFITPEVTPPATTRTGTRVCVFKFGYSLILSKRLVTAVAPVLRLDHLHSQTPQATWILH
jgi:hypothetical protein